MQMGRLVELGGCEQVCDAPREEYTRRLIAATPEMPVVLPDGPTARGAVTS